MLLRAVLLAAGATGAAGAAAFTPNRKLNYTISDMDGMLTWFPDTLGLNDTSSWTVSFDGLASKDLTGNNAYEPGMMGVGNSSHSASGSTYPSLMFSFVGTAFTVRGNYVAQSTGVLQPVQANVDSAVYGFSPTTGSGVLAQLGDLPYGFHEVGIRLTNKDSMWTVDSVDIETGAWAAVSRVADPQPSRPRRTLPRLRPCVPNRSWSTAG